LLRQKQIFGKAGNPLPAASRINTMLPEHTDRKLEAALVRGGKSFNPEAGSPLTDTG